MKSSLASSRSRAPRTNFSTTLEDATALIGEIGQSRPPNEVDCFATPANGPRPQPRSRPPWDTRTAGLIAHCSQVKRRQRRHIRRGSGERERAPMGTGGAVHAQAATDWRGWVAVEPFRLHPRRARLCGPPIHRLPQGRPSRADMSDALKRSRSRRSPSTSATCISGCRSASGIVTLTEGPAHSSSRRASGSQTARGDGNIGRASCGRNGSTSRRAPRTKRNFSINCAARPALQPTSSTGEIAAL